jgi:hypothetical protein
MIYITNKFESIKLPYSQELLEWLMQTYPKSQYKVIEK